MRGSLSGASINPTDITIARLTSILSGIERKDGCWIHSQRHHTGYTYARIHQVKHGIHRILKVAAMGHDIPLGMVTDHLCNNRSCVNPSHIEIVTQSINARRGRTGIALKANPHRARQLQVLSVRSKMLSTKRV